MIDWKIQSRAQVCQACEKSFADKQPYYTLLFDKKQAMERLDVCAACWEAQYSQGANDRKDFVSFWQGVFSEPPPPPPEPIQKETAESLLRKLLEQNNPEYVATCFILAVMLERKRILKVKAQTTDQGQRTLIYEHAKNGDLFTILDPHLQLQQLDETQRKVAHLLEHGMHPPLPPLAASEGAPPPVADNPMPTQSGETTAAAGPPPPPAATSNSNES